MMQRSSPATWGNRLVMPLSLSTTLRCGAALSTLADSRDALREACGLAREQLGGGHADLAMLFCSPHHASLTDQLASDACDVLGTENLIGCTGEAIVGTSREVEHD